ncbi:MAG: CNNM domain-containing protein, partial [Eubacteriales bacterium]|nr:CNNM domain-containing protein [Eubacteriales bacterium]
AVFFAFKENISPLWLAVLSYVPVLLVLCLVYMLFCVALPQKTVRLKAEETARSLLPFIRTANAVFNPFAYMINRISSGLATLSGLDLDAEVEQVTEDEIRMLVDAGEEKGAIEEAERDMIEKVFEFNNMTAEECMTHRTDMQSIYLEDTDDNILKIIEDTGYSRFPVYEEDLDHIIGVLTTRDFLMNRTKSEPLKLKSLLRPVRFVPETVRT